MLGNLALSGQAVCVLGSESDPILASRGSVAGGRARFGGVYVAPVLSGNTTIEGWTGPGADGCSPLTAAIGGGGTVQCFSGIGTDGADGEPILSANFSAEGEEVPAPIPSSERPVRGFVAILVPPDSPLACPGEGNETAKR